MLQSMSLESLKEQSEKIRSMSSRGSHIHWPLDFKRQVIKARSEGISGRALSRATGIAYTTLISWKLSAKPKNKKNNFKRIHIEASGPPEHMTLRLPRGSEVTGLVFSDLCELLKRGLI